MATCGKIDSPPTELTAQAEFQRAFEYLKAFLSDGSEERKRLLAMSVGDDLRLELGGGMFAIEHSYITKEQAKGRFESHRKHIDIQAIIEGEELILTAPIGGLTVDTPYDDGSDVVFYHDPAKVSGSHILKSGMFAVFHPEDGHKPSLTNEKPTRIFKTVVKVPVSG